ncbi:MULTISPECIES: RNA polymerase sigma factor [Frigoribacterium]|jgi:RNA polymerase sigma-70 factor (ECF subfamily)|uniref:RNA polymerase sigma factor n=1 Tax=Frigoribacterium TaxID=96492 RepID=UPI001420C1FE|nr:MULTISPECIES: sigma-70 family RNA polymerase sigma factor [Frigoribacterium]NII51996.1 RNA polymerase sigma-70 factor (ECF subfamily) [Frigoribacterium endophyticum]QNE43764.1 sigma-70 family RNA polymerase sigma factor [Frigoribacterium sp. NBH87]
MDLTTESDSDLVRRTATGDRHALSTIFDRYAPAVTRYAWALVDSRMDVEEVVQDTLVTMWRRSAEIVLHDGSLLPWLLVACRNHAMNLRRKRVRDSADELPLDLADLDQEDAAEARERLRWVRAEIDALSPLDQQVIELCLIEGRSYAEAAKALGISVGSLTQRVSRSRARLRKAVTNDGR